MRSTVNADLCFGMVTVQVGVSPAVTSSASVRFTSRHKGCGGQVKQPKVCEKCSETLDATQVERAFEHRKGEFVTISDEELEAIIPGRSKAITVNKFVKGFDFLDALTDKTYWLVPSQLEPHVHAYALVHEAMRASDRIGVGTNSLWGKEHPTAIRADSNGLMIHLLRDTKDTVLPDFELPSVGGKELEVAKKVITSMTEPLFPTDFRSYQKQETLQLIADKLKGISPVAKPIDAPPVMDLMDALAASVRKSPTKAGGKS